MLAPPAPPFLASIVVGGHFPICIWKIFSSPPYWVLYSCINYYHDVTRRIINRLHYRNLKKFNNKIWIYFRLYCMSGIARLRSKVPFLPFHLFRLRTIRILTLVNITIDYTRFTRSPIFGVVIRCCHRFSFYCFNG
jgi:hypothetical protein